MDWFEAVTENFMDSGGRPLRVLEDVRRHYPVALHGVSLSIGSADPLDLRYLDRLKTLADRIEPAIVSDHLCWTGVEGENLHDLLPLPFTPEAVDYLAARVARVQEHIGRRILVENVSSYVTYRHSTMPEWEFLTAVARRSGCGILLDLNNIYVNSKNHSFDPYDYLRGVPTELVGQFHLAGHTDMGTFLFDTHAAEVTDPVWDLYREALRLYGRVSTLIEWDEAIPDFQRLAAEATKARGIYQAYPAQAFRSGTAPAALPALSGTAGAREGSSPPEALREGQRLLRSTLRPGVLGRQDLSRVFDVAGPERLSAYANGTVARFHEALSETYQAARHLVGADAFAGLAYDYANAYPSHDYNLNHVGRHFPDFLASAAIIKELGFLADLARLEWRVSEAFHAPDAPPFDPTALAGASDEEQQALRFGFHPAAALVRSSWPILDLWEARRTPVAQLHLEVVGRPQNVLVYRSGIDVRCEKLDTAQAGLLERLFGGGTLGQAVASLENGPVAAEDLPVGEWFAAWASRGILREALLPGAASTREDRR